MFEAFAKIPRLKRDCVVTEKIDGTNAQVFIDCAPAYPNPLAIIDGFGIWAGSRSRFIQPGKNTDNFGFAAWVQQNAAELIKLGPGRHFGEWYGLGIQRGYGLRERRFALFNAGRWTLETPPPACCSIVPVIYCGPFCTAVIDSIMDSLKASGSAAVPGYMNPEGIIIYHSASRSLFKWTFNDGHKDTMAEAA